ncbi:MAG TPA: NnrU family protein [Usitatibacter sp.]|nr:NnrU family protein [Usitatibacter sp.]
MGSFFSLLYGGVVYIAFVGTFLYAIGFVANLGVPKSIDTGAAAPLPVALAVDLALLGLFAVQHSLMARRSFKRWWTRIVPAHLERSTFCLAATAALALLLWQWRPIPEPVIWNVANPAAVLVLRCVFFLGWVVLFTATFLINHFELFGLRQVWAYARGTDIPAPQFRTPFLYRYVRHPIYLGFVLAFWAAPVMTAGHLLFSVACTGYILVGIWFEERDLIAQFGDLYRLYRRQVAMLLPMPGASPSAIGERRGQGRG